MKKQAAEMFVNNKENLDSSPSKVAQRDYVIDNEIKDCVEHQCLL